MRSSPSSPAQPNTPLQGMMATVTPRITGYLQYFSGEQVNEYISKLNLKGHRKVLNVGLIEQKFGMKFIQRPINLMLLGIWLTEVPAGNDVDIPDNQTALLNLVLHHILLAYAKKKKLLAFQLTTESPLNREDIPTEVKQMLKQAGKLCYSALKEGCHLLNIEKGAVSRADLLATGIFTEGPGDNWVALSHKLFMDYLTALYLSKDDDTCDRLIKNIRDKSGVRLIEVVSSLGLENTLRLLVGLLPATGKLLSNMFVIEQSKMNYPTEVFQSDLQYELDLFHECTDEGVKSAIASGLLHATIAHCSDATDCVRNLGSHYLLNCYSKEARQLFLQKTYNTKVCERGARPALKRIKEERRVVCDGYFVAFALLYNCIINIHPLVIAHCLVPIQAIIQNMTGVSRLELITCTLCDKTTELLSFKIKDTPVAQQGPAGMETSVKEMFLYNIKGLSHLHIMHNMHCLRLNTCGQIILNELCQVFPDVSLLWLSKSQVVCPVSTHWFSVKELVITRCGEVDIAMLLHMFVHLQALTVWHTKLTVEGAHSESYQAERLLP